IPCTVKRSTIRLSEAERQSLRPNKPTVNAWPWNWTRFMWTWRSDAGKLSQESRRFCEPMAVILKLQKRHDHNDEEAPDVPVSLDGCRTFSGSVITVGSTYVLSAATNGPPSIRSGSAGRRRHLQTRRLALKTTRVAITSPSRGVKGRTSIYS